MRGIRLINELNKEFKLDFCKYNSHYIYVTQNGVYPSFFLRFTKRRILINVYKEWSADPII